MDELYFKLLAAIAPAIVLAIIMLRKDRRPEPIGWLLAAVGLGALVVVTIIFFGDLILPDISADTYTGALLTAFINAAIPEETLKFAALYYLVKRCRHFDEMFDGIVYAVCIGMGFAGLENILYLFGAGEYWVAVGIFRALTAVPMHYVFAVIMGAFFSLGWFDVKNRKRYMGAALLLPIIVHGIYDTLCFSMDLDKGVGAIILIVFLVGFKYLRRYVRSLVDSMLRLDGYEPTK